MLRYGNDIYNRYNMRGKVDLNINPWLDLSTNTAFTFSDYDSPVFIDDLFFWNVNRTPSLSVPKIRMEPGQKTELVFWEDCRMGTF